MRLRRVAVGPNFLAAVAAVAGAWTVRSFWVAASESAEPATTNTLDAMSMTWSF